MHAHLDARQGHPPHHAEIFAVLFTALVAENSTMSHAPYIVAVLNTARRLRRIQDLEARYTVKLIRQLEQLPVGATADPLENLLGSQLGAAAAMGAPIVDQTAMTVTWRGKSCLLGNTHLLGVMERIGRNPNRWVPYDRLKWDLWHNESIGDGAVKVTVVRLRQQLCRHGMDALAAMAVQRPPLSRALSGRWLVNTAGSYRPRCSRANAG
jgi:hypothetical protein